MSNPIVSEAADVVDVDTGAAKDNALDKAEELTPDEQKPKPEPHKEEKPDPTDGANGVEEVRELLGQLGDRLGEVEGAVAALKAPDKAPAKKRAWTQKGRRRKDDDK